jgi:hypothetical protein
MGHFGISMSRYTFRSPLWPRSGAWVVKGIGASLALASTVSVCSASSGIPRELHGAWSRNLESCESDSDGNYFFSAHQIEAWEVTYKILKLRSRKGSTTKFRAIHTEFDMPSPVDITIRSLSANKILFISCEATQCYSETVRRCPKEKPL